ncbi:MAG: hypothetical protein WBK86_07590 [Halanaerobiales bacterium]
MDIIVYAREKRHHGLKKAIDALIELERKEIRLVGLLSINPGEASDILGALKEISASKKEIKEVIRSLLD